MRAFLLVFSVIFAVGASSGCATGPRPIADTVFPVSQETELGKQMSAEIEQELKLLDNPQVNQWIKELGIKVATSARKDIPKGIQFTFKVVDDDQTVNAFALPGGYIYIYTGLIKKASNEAEIVAVLGHEVAHVTQRHIAKRLVAAYGIQAVASVALGQNPGLLAELVAGVVANGYILKHSRDAERESDDVGLDYTIATGYTPRGYVTFFNKLAESPSPPAIISSHPNPRERVKNAQERIAKLRSSVVNASDGKAKYDQMVKHLK